MFHRYRYEAEYYPTLSRLPLDLRRKLDATGIKLSLKDWLAFAFEERTVLCHLPCESVDEARAFAAYIDFLSRQYRGAPAEKTAVLDSRLWDSSQLPEGVVEKSRGLENQTVTLERWRGWQPHQRYALYKTAVSKSQPGAFERVLEQLLHPIDGES